MAGTAPFERLLPARATASDLWASVDAFAVEGTGLDRLQKRHRVRLDAEARRRFIAYVAQARQYHLATRELAPASKPLPAYYFALNLTKAFLTAVAPSTTVADRIGHGVSARFERRQRYRIQQETITISQDGVFRLLAERTGMKHCYSAGYTIRLVDLLPYLAEGYDLYADAMDKNPKLLPIKACYPLFRNREGWLRVELDRDILGQRNIGPAAVVSRCRVFGQRFRLVQSDQPTASYESTNTFTYRHSTREVADQLCGLFDASLVASNRTVRGPRRFLALSNRPQLLSHEAVTFALLHHLSSMVRYRPQDVERLSGTRYFWLLASWVDRACENFLLNMASRITREEHVIE